jgi:hypothetical protein
VLKGAVDLETSSRAALTVQDLEGGSLPGLDEVNRTSSTSTPI